MMVEFRKIIEEIDINEGLDVEKEIKEYEEIIDKLYKKEIHPDRFKGYRLLFGTYGVRKYGEGMHMQRIKIPSGFIFSDQIRVIADLVEKYAGSGVAHLTTRQDIQLHYVELKNIPIILRELARVGVTTREACGNSVRNITSSYLSGVNPKEKFDVLPYAIFCTRYFLRHPLSSTLPRKFKIAFSESDEDYAFSRIHDIGAIADIRANGKVIKGFRVYVGGGLGPYPTEAQLLIDFVPIEEFYLLVEATLRVFHKYGVEERKNRNRARMKFLIARIGFGEFKNLVMKEWEWLKRSRNVEDLRREIEEYVEKFPIPSPPQKSFPPQKKPLPTWWEKYVFKQKQDGYFGVYIKPYLGNIKPDDLRWVADFIEKYGAGYARITPQQNIFVPWVEEKYLAEALWEICDRGFAGEDEGREIVSCPGAYSCKLAVTHPYNLTDFIGRNVKNLGGLRINISGCPNSCGQHHIGDIGFYGASMKVDGKVAPYYILLVGGYANNEKAIFGKVVAKIPPKNAPYVVEEIVKLWKEKRKDGEKFYEFVERIGLDEIRKIVAPYTKVSPSDPDAFYEPGISEEFRMEAESRGECAGSLLDLMAINLFEAKRDLYEAEDFLRMGDFKVVKEVSLGSIIKCAKMYIYLFGVEPKTDEEILTEFEKRVVPEKWFCGNWENIKEKFFEFKDKNSKEDILKLYDIAKRFVSDADRAYLRIQPNLKVKMCLREGGEEKYVPE